MRIAVKHTDKGHDNGGWFAYGVGRIEDFVNPVTGETTQASDAASAILARAHKDFPEPDYEHRIEVLVDKEDVGGESEWVPIEKATKRQRTGTGASIPEVTLATAQAATSDQKAKG